MNKLEKVYLVEFIRYTNGMRNTVSTDCEEIGEIEYLHVSDYGFLVRESELDKYRKYGGGFRSITLVGEIAKRDEETDKEIDNGSE